jgi:hypothetical protein
MMAKAAPVSSIARIAIRALAIIVVAFALCSGLALRSRADELDFPPADFVIRSPDGATILGHSHYDVSHVGDTYVVQGANRYLNGQYDTEVEKMKLAPVGAMPVLVSYEHSFFDTNRSPLIDDRLDVASGEGSCTRYRNGKPVTKAEVFALAPDIYAGASLLISIQYELRRYPNKTIGLHDFGCVPEPRVLSVKARITERQLWPYYPGSLVDVNVDPDLGWWTVLVSAFLPKTDAWFDPGDNLGFVGGTFTRYYGGPKVMLVRETPEATASRSSEASSSASPH